MINGVRRIDRSRILCYWFPFLAAALSIGVAVVSRDRPLITGPGIFQIKSKTIGSRDAFSAIESNKILGSLFSFYKEREEERCGQHSSLEWTCALVQRKTWSISFGILRHRKNISKYIVTSLQVTKNNYVSQWTHQSKWRWENNYLLSQTLEKVKLGTLSERRGNLKFAQSRLEITIASIGWAARSSQRSPTKCIGADQLLAKERNSPIDTDKSERLSVKKKKRRISNQEVRLARDLTHRNWARTVPPESSNSFEKFPFLFCSPSNTASPCKSPSNPVEDQQDKNGK